MIRFHRLVNAVCVESFVCRFQCARLASGDPCISISPPYAIKRTHTELLEALSQTVGEDTTAPHFSLIDDPALIPTERIRLQNFYLSKEMGKKAARILASEWPTLFQYDHDEPRLDVFRPLAEMLPETADPTEEVLLNFLDQRKIVNAVKFYERLTSEGVDVSTDTLKKLFFLICYYNEQNPPNAEIEEWHGSRNFLSGDEKQNAFKQDGMADLLFETLEKTDEVYSAMIAGLCKFSSEEAKCRALILYKCTLQEMKEKKLMPFAEAFYGLIKCASSFEEAQLYCKDMCELGIRPDIHVFDSILQAIIDDSEVDRDAAAEKVLQEAQKCSCTLSLTTYLKLLEISQLKPDKRLPLTRLVQILDELEKYDVIEAVIAKEQNFYVKAMHIAFQANNLEIAERVSVLYASPKNHAKLPALTDEAIFYGYYLRICAANLNIKELTKKYKSLVPRSVSLNRSIAAEMFDRLMVNSHWPLLRRLIEDVIAGRLLLDNYCARKTCFALSRLELVILLPDEREQYHDLVLRIIEIFDEMSKFEGRSQRKWTPIYITACARLLINANEREKGWKLFQLFFDKTATEGDNASVTVFGFPYGADIQFLMEDALRHDDWENACNCLEVISKYSAEMKVSVKAFAELILRKCKLTPLQQNMLKNYAKLRDYK